MRCDPPAPLGPGSLHYMVMPYNEEGIPTNGIANGVIYHFERGHGPTR